MQNNSLRNTLCFAALGAALLLLLLLNIMLGSVSIPARQVLEILAHPGGSDTAARIIWNIRLPRTLAAALLGGALAVSGYLLQTFFANPIAGPFVLGISSGAKLTVALTMILFLEKGISCGSVGLVMAAFAGSLAATGFILLLSRRVKRMSLLVVGGVMVGYICSAITDFAVTFADDANIVNLHNWSLGSFSGMSWGQVAVMAAVVGVSLLLCVGLVKPIGAYLLGEVYAANLGVDVKRFRVQLILLSSLLSACVTAFAGPISFVGIAVPHLMKTLFRTAKPLTILPAAFLMGGIFCLFCDLLARSLFAPTELSVSSVTAVFGAPVVIWMMARRGGMKGE